MKKSFNTRLYSMYILALLPLIIFGFYKNGIELYKKDYVDIIMMFKPILILLMSVTGAFLGSVLREYRVTKTLNWKLVNKTKGNVIEALLVACILPLKSSPLIVFGIVFLVNLFLNKLKINKIALLYLVVEGINVLLKLNVFANPYEASTVLNYDGLDLFWGLGNGGIFSTSIILILLGFLFLSFNKLYKKEMVVASLIVFFILGIVPFMIKGNYNDICPLIFGYNILFVLVFILPNLYSSSYTMKGQVLSGILVGVLSYALYFVTPYTSAVIAVLIVSLISGIIDRIFVIK